MDGSVGYSETQNQAFPRSQPSAKAVKSQNGRQQSKPHPHLRKRGFRNGKMNHKFTPLAERSIEGSDMAREADVKDESVNSSLSGAFQCGICPQNFSSMELLSDHMEEHCKKDIYQCNMCNDVFDKAESLSVHLDLHTNVVKAFKCGICNAGFLENAALLSHLKLKHEVLPFLYKCNVCLDLFKEVSKFISHAAKKHPPVCKEYKCALCDKRFTHGTRLTLHVQKHSEEDFQQQTKDNPIDKIEEEQKKMKIPLRSRAKTATISVQSISMVSQCKNVTKRQYEECPSLSLKKSKPKNKVVKKSEDSVMNEHISSEGDDNEFDEVNEAPLKSSKKSLKSSTEKVKSQEEKKPPAIKNNEELIAAYKRIDPESQKEVFDCDACGERFYECLSFTQHRADHFFDDKFCVNCHHCKHVFDNFDHLQDHIDDGRCRGYVCETCGKSFALEPFLLTHQVKEHVSSQKKKGANMICNICEKSFSNRTAFLRHASSHSEIKCIQCKLCRHAFTTPETLFGHLRTTHSLIPLTRKKYNFSCKMCDIHFMKKEALQNHESVVHKVKPQECDNSGAEPKKPKKKERNIITESQVRRTGHWRSMEDDKKRRTCHICNRVFRRFKDVRRHIGTHTKPYLCSHCGKAFPYRYSLDAHIKAFHSAENPFKCEICMKYFSCPRSLIVHQRIHTGERPHQCPICQKSFRQVANLSMHIKLHNSDKPIKCSLCDYRCRHMGYLKRHMSTHSKEKKHFCPICNKGFTEKPNLNHHLKRHTKIKNHVCAVCGHRFAERYYLNNHMRIHTKEKPYVCPVCNRAFTMRPNMVSHIKKTHPSYNYQPIRPSYQTVAATTTASQNDINGSSSMPNIPSSIIVTQPSAINNIANTNNTIVNASTHIPLDLPPLPPPPPPPPPPPAPSALPQLNPNIPIYHSTTETQLSKLDELPFLQRDSIETQMLRDQHNHQVLMREPQILNDPNVVRNQVILREPVMEQTNMQQEDTERRHYINMTPSNRLMVPETTGFELHRESSTQDFPVVLQSQDYMTYPYSNLATDPFLQGFFPIQNNQHNQHPQQKS